MLQNNSRKSSRSLASAAVGLALFAAAPAARAESGVLNLHLDLGFGLPVFGNLTRQVGSSTYQVVSFGGVGQASLDWQFATPVALELTGGGGFFSPPPSRTAGVPYGNAALGVRVRFLDNREGYANEPGGDYQGNSWFSAHVGYHNLEGHRLGFDVGGGYEFSVLRPMQVGAFARVAVLPDFRPMRQPVDVLAVVGVGFSFELTGRPPAVDTDRDTLSDEREQQRWHTNPNNPDTDGDALNDGLETRTNTNPTNPDTDGDGAPDGTEDANHNGTPDATEADPRVPDTDGGGVPDGWELTHSHNPRDRADDDSDRDRVLEHIDQCPGTPSGTEVDARGCAILRAELVLTGVNFATNSTDILPESAQMLERAAQILRENPTVRVEVSGHTDNVGSHADNMRLSQGRAQSVRDWMVAHGLDAARFEVRGYGETRARATNDTEEGRAQNRRIEFHRLDQPQPGRSGGR